MHLHEGGYLAVCRIYKANGLRERITGIDSGMNGFGGTKAEAAANLLANMQEIAGIRK